METYSDSYRSQQPIIAMLEGDLAPTQPIDRNVQAGRGVHWFNSQGLALHLKLEEAPFAKRHM